MALVVQEAAEMMLSPGSMMSLLMPATTFFRSPLPGAVRITLLTPLLCRCSDRPASSRQTPVLSMTMASSIPYSV